MDIQCEEYFLSARAREIWRNADREGEARMLKCLDEKHRENFFGQVIYRNGRVEEERLRELAREAWAAACEVFITQGRAGNYTITDLDYVGYFRQIFWNKFMDELTGAQARKAAAEKFGTWDGSGGGKSASPADIIEDGGDPPGLREMIRELRGAMDRLSAGCQQLLHWKYEKGWSYDKIAADKNVKRDACIDMVSRCKKRCREILQENRLKGNKHN